MVEHSGGCRTTTTMHMVVEVVDQGVNPTKQTRWKKNSLQFFGPHFGHIRSVKAIGYENENLITCILQK